MDSDVRLHLRSCAFCEAACGIRVTADHGTRTILDVRGDPDDPFSQGFVCPKSHGLIHLHADPDRLRRPIRRRGKDWEEIGWDEAMDESADRLKSIQKKHGRHSIAYYLGNPSGHKAPFLLYGPLLIKAIGSMQFYTPGTLDQIPKFVSAAYMFGGPTIQPLADLDRTDHLIVIGNNPVVSQGSMMVAPGIRRRIEGIRQRGGKLVVIDPRRTETAGIADEYVAVRPGADAYLLFAMVDVLAKEGLIRLGAVADHVKNLDELLRMAARFPADRAAAVTSIPAETIRRLARELAAAPTAAIYGRTGTCTQRFGTITSWLIDALNIITGNLDRAGGNLFSGGGIPMGVLFEDNYKDGVFPVGRWHSRVKGLPEAIGMLPTAALADEMLEPGEGQVRGFVTQAGNVILSNPNAGKLQRALDGLEFMLSLDIYVNETTRHADIIIPGPSYAEHSDFAAVTAYETIRKFVKWGAPVFAPEGDTPHDWQIFAGLAARMRGISIAEIEEEYVRELLGVAISASRPEARDVSIEEARRLIGDEPGPDRIFDILIRGGPMGDAFGRVPGGLTLERVKQHPHGLDLGPLDTGMIPGVLRTPDRKIDLAPSQITGDVTRLESEMAALERPGSMLMIGRRDMRSKNAWMHNVEPLAKGKDRCTLLVHPTDADRLGLATGGRARVRTHISELMAPVVVSDEIMPGVVSLPHGWGHGMKDTRQRVANAHAGVNANAIIDEGDLDVPSATTILNGVAVEIEAVAV
ncbi:MAG TPA: molybdopterin-dependent oxidoreductase [Sphingomonas sp.]|nr:molybdopterin-dependent oxidoreductase [Sphingomonas sp.]